MTVYANTNMQILADGDTLAGFAKSLELTAQYTTLDTTNLASGGWVAPIAGLGSFNIKLPALMQDMAATGLDAFWPATSVGTVSTFTVMPTNGGAAIGDPAFFSTGMRTAQTPLMGPVGTLAMASMGFAGTARIIRGSVYHPTAARTATGNGTATAFTAPTATQSLWACFQVTAVSGSGTITFVVATDDNSGFTSGITRITSQAFAGVGAQFTSLAGALTSETYLRPQWTISGFTSVTFNVACGVI